jgi:hypothetical protein
MTEKATGRRTFFHARGANALWAGAGLGFKKIRARIFHLAYLLLLDALDLPDDEFGTKAARLLAAAQAAGLKTSVDVVSEDSNRFARVVTPALKFVDYCILNEIEAGKTTGFKLRQPDGRLEELPPSQDSYEIGAYQQGKGEAQLAPVCLADLDPYVGPVELVGKPVDKQRAHQQAQDSSDFSAQSLPTLPVLYFFAKSSVDIRGLDLFRAGIAAATDCSEAEILAQNIGPPHGNTIRRETAASTG